MADHPSSASSSDKSVIHDLVIANLLCVHKNHRSERFAPILIYEVARRAAIFNFCKAMYATEADVSVPLCSCEWLQRLLNPMKLHKAGYVLKPTKKTRLSKLEIQNLLPKPKTAGFREMKRRDINAVLKLLKKQLMKFTVAPVADKNFIEHYLLPRKGVVETYVVEDVETHEITDFCSFVIRKMEINLKTGWIEVKYAVLFYYAATKPCILNLIRYLVGIACRDRIDIFRALRIMENDLFLDELLFEALPENKVLNYYLYNYVFKIEVMPKDIGLIILL